jgi:sRNA-binding regulator protein Hfq
MYKNDIKEVLKHFLSIGYSPKITTQTMGNVTGIALENLKYKGCTVLVLIRTAIEIQGLNGFTITNKYEFIKYEDESNRFSSMLINKHTISTFTPEVKFTIDTYGAQIHIGKVVKDDMHRIR